MSIAQLNEVAVKRYGKPVIGLDALSALWLAEHILSTTGENVFRIIFVIGMVWLLICQVLAPNFLRLFDTNK